MQDAEVEVRKHYLRPDLLAAISAGLRAAGKDPRRPTPEDLAPVDHFHHGGIDETVTLARLSGFQPSMHVLDVGGGIGGPARLLASQVGCRVTVLDLSPEFCALGRELSARTGLGSRVQFEPASALSMPFPDQAFDGAWTQHSSMNIADKGRLYREIHRVLRSGARLAVHEVMAGRKEGIHFPVPWARAAAINFLQPPEAVRQAIKAAGFAEVAWYDVTTRTLDWLHQRAAAVRAAGTLPPLGVHLLLGEDAPKMFANLIRNVEEGRIEVVQGLFERK